MKLSASSLAIAVLVCTFALPAQAQQTRSGQSAQENRTSDRERRSHATGYFALDLANNQPGYVNKVEEEERPPLPTIPNSRAASALSSRPLLTVRPNDLVIAPATDDKDDND